MIFNRNFIKFILFFSPLFYVSCAGYHFKSYDNPFKPYEISSVGIPMFLNYSEIPQVHGMLTEEMVRMLLSFKKLKICTGQCPQSDAVMIGVVLPRGLKQDVYQSPLSLYTTSPNLKKSIGTRKDFFLPSHLQTSFSVRILLLKHPKPEDIQTAVDLLRASSEGKETNQTMLDDFFLKSRTILDTTLAASVSQTLTLDQNVSLDDGGITNTTKNQGSLRRHFALASFNLIQNYKESILYAY